MKKGFTTIAQFYGKVFRKTTLEQTKGGRYLDSLNLFERPEILTKIQAKFIWDIASSRFANGAKGQTRTFAFGAQRFGKHGERTWWKTEKPILEMKEDVKIRVYRLWGDYKQDLLK